MMYYSVGWMHFRGSWLSQELRSCLHHPHQPVVRFRAIVLLPHTLYIENLLSFVYRVAARWKMISYISYPCTNERPAD